MIKFICEDKEKKSPVFGDVMPGQFFESKHGALWQKVDEFSANLIAHANGIPDALHASWEEMNPINRILPKVTKIEF